MELPAYWLIKMESQSPSTVCRPVLNRVWELLEIGKGVPLSAANCLDIVDPNSW